MHTDYIGSEERCHVIARKLIYWVAAITFTGGAVDATNALDVVRAKATTAPFIARTAVAAHKAEMKVEAKAGPMAERVPMQEGDIAAEESVLLAVSPAAPAAPVMPAVGPAKLFNADPRFEAAPTALAIKQSADAMAMHPPAEAAPDEAIPSSPFEGKALPKPAVTQPEPAAAKVEAPAIQVQLPALAEVPMPRPRPPLTPAQELGLEGKERAKAEQCLARAVYFEARNEPVRGQIAVAQVVLNRVFSPYYPGDVCGVVYQNAHRRLACQFTFACDGIPDIIREKGPWSRAQRIAKQALDSQVWLPEVAKSTHYHATYVRPNWIREMKKMVKHGQHIFYRPHRWGDGSDEAGWGVASLTHSPAQKTKTSKN